MEATRQSQKTWRHHFVPECYLKHFVRDECLYVLDVQKVKRGYREKPRRMQPGGICYLEDYYKIEKEYCDDNFRLGSIDDELFIENTVLKSLEDRYDLLLKKMIEDGKLSLEESIAFCDFIIQLKIRNPYHFEHLLQKNTASWLDAATKTIYQESIQPSFPFPRIPVDVRKMVIDFIVAQSKNDKYFNRKLYLSGLVRRFREPSYKKRVFHKPLIDSQWTLLVAPEEGSYFITSDNPGFSFSANDDKIYNTKFNENFCFHFPLSPRFCLLISDVEKDNSYSVGSHKLVSSLAVDSDTVIRINDKTIQVINKLLIASDDWYIKQVGELNKPTTV